ncbi:expressed unknown protein [Seminavis robusta]|uniref:AB hydrolase-1 domain-containing protein n=1 Tax=Seminavis robusta TaxID=568900 RepID=A0A9N8ENR5_9STRA|nr:expressed unknown protein [Seminavis robusta]|eukprot:Sro1408_g270060.1 n/a (537) ;mRNA; r:5319-7024
MPAVPLWVDIVMVAELGFYLLMRAKIAYLQSVDPLEAYLSSAHILTLEERQRLWGRVMQAKSSDVAAYFESWFFDVTIDDISQHELQNFVCWCYFDGRNQEHLTTEEHDQLDSFVSHARRLIQKEKRKSMKNLDNEVAARAMPRPSKKLVFDAHRKLLDKSLTNSKAIPEAELAEIMRKMTECHETFTEKPSDDEEEKQSRRFGRPTADPLLGIRVAPLTIHLVFFLLEVVLRVALWFAGFRRCRVNKKAVYYYHPGSPQQDKETTPLVFIHGIGVGPVVYLPLIFKMMSSGRPIFLPEISTVSAMRPWVFPGECLNPDQVATTLATMLASHGYTQATFAGHSFGTFWLSYVIKYAPDIVAGLVFMDPVCFCLYDSSLTRSVVYNQPDPGDVGYLIRTDMMVNWSVQRHFSWVRGNLLLEELMEQDVPTVVFLSGDDRVAPSDVQESYLKQHEECQIEDLDSTPDGYFEKGNLNVVVFRGCDHGHWMLTPEKTLPRIQDAMETLCQRSEASPPRRLSAPVARIYARQLARGSTVPR